MSRKHRHFPPGFGGDSISRKDAGRRPSKSILIVTEGQNTEPGYFKALAGLWNVHPKLIQIEPGGEGIPANLVKRAREEIKRLARLERAGKLAFNQLGRFDETWIVFDTEHAQRQGRLDDGVAAARESGFRIAHSSPCFEFWLALHYAGNAPPMTTCAEAIRLLEMVGKLGAGKYSKEQGASEVFFKALVPQVATAVRNARILTGNQDGGSFPANPSTTVQNLVASIHETLPEVMKERFPLM